MLNPKYTRFPMKDNEDWLPEDGFAEKEISRNGFMCMTDFEHVSCAKGGNVVYPSIEDLKENRGCTDECGIVKVRVVLDEIVQDSDF